MSKIELLLILVIFNGVSSFYLFFSNVSNFRVSKIREMCLKMGGQVSRYNPVSWKMYRIFNCTLQFPEQIYMIGISHLRSVCAKLSLPVMYCYAETIWTRYHLCTIMTRPAEMRSSFNNINQPQYLIQGEQATLPPVLISQTNEVV